MKKNRIAVLIPCYNEEKTIHKVVRDCQRELPGAAIYVYNNNSTDNTFAEAKRAGAIVRNEPRQGKGFVVRRMFADIDAEIYVMVDGDDTYDLKAVSQMIEAMVSDGLDLVNGVRKETTLAAYRSGHRFGNLMITRLIQVIFGDQFSDILSGLKVFSRRFVKSFPIAAGGFEIETELIIHALELQVPGREIEVEYKDRPPGSVSKLNTIADGLKIVRMIGDLLKQERPLLVFLIVGLILMLISLLLAYPLFITYLDTGLVPRFPTAILCSALIVLAFLSFSCGAILDTVTRGRQETKRMVYLSIEGPQAAVMKEKKAEPKDRSDASMCP